MSVTPYPTEAIISRKKKKPDFAPGGIVGNPDIHFAAGAFPERIHRLIEMNLLVIQKPRVDALLSGYIDGRIVEEACITNEIEVIIESGITKPHRIENLRGRMNRQTIPVHYRDVSCCLIPPTFSEFKKEVLAELEVLRAKLKPQDLKKLNFKKFDHTKEGLCILGLLTGSSISEEAQQLLPKKYSNIASLSSNLINKDSGSNNHLAFKNHEMRPGSKFCAIEKYFFMSYRPTHKKIFAYLKGQTETLSI